MKTTKLLTVLVLALGSAGALSLSSGCAATATRESTGEYVDDATITTKVKAQLVHDKVVSALDVKVETFKGIVQLSGFVDTPQEKSRAEADAARVAGVKGVQNNITVK